MSNSSSPSAAASSAPAAGDEAVSTIMRSFARLEHLKRHERSHTKEKPFECPECSRCFARRDLLLRHQQKLHQTTTPSSRPRNRRESTSGAVPGASRARKNSIAGPAAAAAAAANNNAASMRPRANTISHVDVHMLAAANVQASRMPPTHSRHPSLIGLPNAHSLDAYGMQAALAQRGVPLGLPKLETHGINGLDFSNSGLRTAPPLAFNSDYDMDSLFFGASPGSTINPNALHYSDSPPSMSVGGQLSPFMHGLPDMSAQPVDDGFDWLTGFDHQMSFNPGPPEAAMDGSSPSALSTTSQSGISDVMVDGSNHHTASVVSSSMWQPSIMGPPQLTTPLFDLSGSVFPDLLNGAPLSPQPSSAKTMGDNYFSTPPPSLNSLSPSVMSALNNQNLNHALTLGPGPETPSSMNGSANSSTNNTATTPRSSSSSDSASTLPSTQDLRRYVGAYLRYFHAHLPFVHIATLTFEVPPQLLANGRNSGIGGTGCLLLSMAAIGALFELEHEASMELFGMAKKMIQLYLDERRKANVRKAESIRRVSLSDQTSQQQDPSVETPVWLVQAMLLNVVYGHNCGDKRSGEIAATHAAALMVDVDGAGGWNGSGTKGTTDEQAEWLRWKDMEERKRTLYAVFTASSLLVSAYNHSPALTNSEILLDLPCDEEFFAAESAAAFRAKGGIAAANHNRMTFHEALGELLRTNEKQKQRRPSTNSAFGSAVDVSELPKSDLKPSTFGCHVLINALHNYIWETRQRHPNKVWTNEETEKMHRHIEPALRAWHAAWANNPQHSAKRPNPYGATSLSADCIPLLDLAYIRLFVNLSRSKEKFWQRDWDGFADELARGSEVIQNAEHPRGSNTDCAVADSPMTGSFLSAQEFSKSTSRREKHLRKAAFFAADSLAVSDKLGVTFANLTSRELPLQANLCVYDCAVVLAEWVATLQDRVGSYLGILGSGAIDLAQVPAIMLLEEEDVKLMDKIGEIIRGAELKMNMDLAQPGSGNGRGGYAAKLMRVTAYMFDKATVWPVTRLIVACLETHASHMRARAEKSVMTLGH
ncbi:hypothetical protein N0V88_007638 [Collariella sp. IMI 366227]|nr:hypothetical protein N0V88_007638 [Collariella sp. IMI 366227]